MLSLEFKNWSIIFIVIFLISVISVAEADGDWVSWQEESEINVSIVGNSIINLDSNNRLVRAYVDIQNFDPTDGYYYMRIIQPATGKIITENEIVISEKGNGQAGSDVGYMITDDAINTNGTAIQGDYLIEVFSERGSAIGGTTFSIIKPSDPQNLQHSQIHEAEENGITGDIDPSTEYDENETELENIKKIPDWVKNLFILYADGSITDDELISALKFLIEQDIIQITQ